jgi:hypothetical protein
MGWLFLVGLFLFNFLQEFIVFLTDFRGQDTAGRQGYREKQGPKDQADQQKSPWSRSRSIFPRVVRRKREKFLNFHNASPYL